MKDWIRNMPRRALLLLALASMVYSCATSAPPEPAVAAKPHTVDDYLAMGESQYRKGAYQAAEKSYKRVLESDPDHAEANYKLGVIYHREGRINESRAQFLKAILIDPAYSKAYYNLGAIYSTAGETYDGEKAAFFFKKYVELEPKSEHRENIERWLAAHGAQKPERNPSVKPIASPTPTAADRKEWLKDQADEMGAD